jgi:hypothetical protein
MVSEAGVPASVPILRGRIDSEINGMVNTGFAVANPNNSEATVSFFFTDPNGTDSGWGSLKLAPHGQIARFLNQSPFAAPNASGTFTFTSDIPVNAIALRGFTNERSEFLVTTLPVAEPDLWWTPGTVFFPHTADGGGWTTQLVLVNPTDNPITGTFTFIDQNGTPGTSSPYQIPPRTSRRFMSPNAGSVTRVGSAEVTADPANAAPVGLAIFSYTAGGITVSQAGVPSLDTGNSFNLFVETVANGSVRSGLAIRNSSASATNVNFELYRLDGSPTGMTGSLAVPANGQRSAFLDEIPGFQSLPQPFEGFVRLASDNAAQIAVVGLRGNTNQRGDFLVTTTSPVDETTAPASMIVFPHIVDGGGYTTQFVLYGNGALNLHSQSGGSLSLNLQ